MAYIRSVIPIVVQLRREGGRRRVSEISSSATSDSAVPPRERAGDLDQHRLLIEAVLVVFSLALWSCSTPTCNVFRWAR